MDPRRKAKTTMIAICVAVVMLILIALGAALIGESAHAATPVGAFTTEQIKSVRIPETSVRYRRALEREAEATWGISAPVARIAAQIHQESSWDPTAESAYAQGLSEFTPATAKWLPSICPTVGPPDVWDAEWSLRAIVCYDAWLNARVKGATECDRWAFTLSAYNGGLGWVARDQAMAFQARADPLRWFGHVEKYSPRAEWARTENRGYPRRILLLLEPAYARAGWPGQVACP